MSSVENTNTPTKEMTSEELLRKKIFENELKRVETTDKIKKIPFTMKEKQALVENLVKFNTSNPKKEVKQNLMVKSVKEKTKKLTKKQQLERLMRIKNTLDNNKNIPAILSGSTDVYKEKVNKTIDKLKKVIAVEKVLEDKKLKEKEQVTE